MEITRDLLDDLYEEIRKHNQLFDETAIPYANDIIKYICSDSGATDLIVKEAISILIDIYKIFAIEIVAEDSAHSVDRVEGYVVTERDTIHALLNFYQDQLVSLYSKKFNKRLGAHQVIKEIFPMMSNLNNTEIGQIANKAIMLNEYYRLLEKEWKKYQPKHQNEMLNNIIEQMGIDLDVGKNKSRQTNILKPEAQKTKQPKPTFTDKLRAVDSKQYKEYSNKSNSYPLDRILNIYGIDFFLKVNFRKYNFKYLKKIVDDRQIIKRTDLIKIKEMLGTIKQNMQHDKELENYKDDLYKLEKSISHMFYFSKPAK